MVCAISEASDQPAHTRRLIKAFACRLNIIKLLTKQHLGFLSLTETAQARLSLFIYQNATLLEITCHAYTPLKNLYRQNADELGSWYEMMTLG